METVRNKVNGKRVLFISTKNKDYIRNHQEIELIKSNTKTYYEIAFSDKSYIKRIVKVYLKCCKGKWKDIDIFFIGFAPQLILPFLRLWHRKKEVVIDFFISLYDTFVHDRKLIKDGFICARLLHKLDEMTLQNCDHIIVDTLADARYFSEEFNIPVDKMEVLYLEADAEIYDVNKYNVMKKNEKLLVLYFGSILPLQGVEVILEAAKLLKEQTDISFVLIGPIKAKNKHKLIDGNIEFYDWLPQEKLAEKIAEADVCLAGHFNEKISKARRTIPGKAYIYETMDKTMILGKNPANQELFSEDERHFFSEMGNAKVLAEVIVMLRDKWKGTGDEQTEEFREKV